MSPAAISGDRVAVVTGGAGGIGREICRRLIERDIRCVLADRNQAALDRATQALGERAHAFLIDLSDLGALGGLVEHVEARFGRLDILVNNAAITDTTSFELRSVESIVGELHVNLLSPIVLTRLAFPLLQKGGDGRVINTVSLGGLFPLPETSVYSASKFGLRGAMLCLGMDAARHGVRVGNVMPSATETPMLIREALQGGNTLQFMDPPQRPADVAEQVLRLLDAPGLERYPKLGESWILRLGMLVPNWLPWLIGLIKNRGDAGHRRYLASLEARGVLVRRDGALELDEDALARESERS